MKDRQATTENAVAPEALDRCRRLLEIQCQIVQMADQNRLIQEACDDLRRQITPEAPAQRALVSERTRPWLRLRKVGADVCRQCAAWLNELLHPRLARSRAAHVGGHNPFDTVGS